MKDEKRDVVGERIYTKVKIALYVSDCLEETCMPGVGQWMSHIRCVCRRVFNHISSSTVASEFNLRN